MINVTDVAAYLLSYLGETTAIKLQLLVYYAQAWFLAWEGKPLVPGEFEPRDIGPIHPELYAIHKDQFRVSNLSLGIAVKDLTPIQKEALDLVLSFYGGRRTEVLRLIAVNEDPWLLARGKQLSSIPNELIQGYYSELANGGAVNESV